MKYASRFKVRYVIQDIIGIRYKLKDGNWALNSELSTESDNLLSFTTRDECDVYIKKAHFNNCQSWGLVE